MSEAAQQSAKQPRRNDHVRNIVVADINGEQVREVAIAVTPNLAAALARSAAINHGRDHFDLTFSSTILAIFHGEDDMGRWLRSFFKKRGVAVSHLYERVGKKEDEALSLARQGEKEAGRFLSSPLRRSPSMRRALDEAHEIAEGSGRPVDEGIHLGHMLASLISLPDYHEQDYSALGIDRAELSASFVAHISRVLPNEGEVWRRFHNRRFPGTPLSATGDLVWSDQRAPYDADAYTSRDLLDIEREVRALAYVIASKSTSPPLSIGLFGDWGSGKTFFMRHLRRQIARVSKQAAEADASSSDCYPYIAQIEFNAWHYQDSDLWASLVDHILRNLAFGEAGDEDEVKLQRRGEEIARQLAVSESRLETSSTRSREIEDQVMAAEQNLKQLQKEEQASKERLARELAPARVIEAVRVGLELDENQKKEIEAVLQSIGIGSVGKSTAELQSALSDAKRELNSAAGFLMPLLHASDASWRIAGLIAAFAAPVAIGFAIHYITSEQQELLRQLGSMAGALTTLLITAKTWIERQTKWMRDMRQRIEPVSSRLDERFREHIEQLTLEQGQKVADQVAELQQLKQLQSAELQRKVDAEAEIRKLQGERRDLERQSAFETFLDSRLRQGDYEKRLGLAALIRRDFERLSRFIQKANKGQTNGEVIINRIVLYVDDLDRCSEDKVVEVLRAVHLLLAFEAFVVVVGVDSRWVAHCLNEKYPMLRSDGAAGAAVRATPLDYLEKIFQIPIRLEPIPREVRVNLAQTLLRSSVTSDVGSRPSKRTPPANVVGVGDPPPEYVAPSGEEPAETVQTASRPAQSSEIDEEADEDRINLSPAALHVTQEEIAFIERLGDLLSPSPRVLKRFVNTYRLFKAVQPAGELEDAAADPPEYQICMFLLAVFVAMADLSKVIQSVTTPSLQLQGGIDTDFLDRRLLSAVHEILQKSRNEQAMKDWDRVAGWAAIQKWPDLPVTRYARWIHRVGRYTFNLDQT